MVVGCVQQGRLKFCCDVSFVFFETERQTSAFYTAICDLMTIRQQNMFINVG